ncbi:HAD-IA family hydrolase [Idiomarina seosinensis]|uniref:HAD family hydrolase n=1 Tax=Idiomarina seosinensis TaxID=281739 RepID=UPI003850634C
MSKTSDVKPVKAILFDLDGTLLDTAMDLGAALNHVCRYHGRPEVAEELFSKVASHGSRGLLELAFADHMEDLQSNQYQSLKNRFLSHYEQNIAVHSKLFDGISQLLSTLANANIAVAIVTNKPHALTQLLLPHYPELAAIEIVVGGDTLAVAKPHPDPLLHAAKQLLVDSDQCIYVGDAERDIEAGRNAGMVTVLANYGYINDSDQPQRWGADYTIEHPLDLLNILAISERTH